MLNAKVQYMRLCLLAATRTNATTTTTTVATSTTHVPGTAQRVSTVQEPRPGREGGRQVDGPLWALPSRHRHPHCRRLSCHSCLSCLSCHLPLSRLPRRFRLFYALWKKFANCLHPTSLHRHFAAEIALQCSKCFCLRWFQHWQVNTPRRYLSKS
jgi:hypothetical protein